MHMYCIPVGCGGGALVILLDTSLTCLLGTTYQEQVRLCIKCTAEELSYMKGIDIAEAVASGFYAEALDYMCGVSYGRLNYR
jgi:hypothetical protein